MSGPPRAIQLAAPLGLATLAWLTSELLNRNFEPFLRSASARLAACVLRTAGIAVSRDDTRLQMPWGTYDVLLPCSGGKFLAATLVIGFVAAAISTERPARRLVLVASLLPLALLGNALRVSALVLLPATTGPTVHRLLGLLAFGFVALAIAWLAALGPFTRERDSSTRPPP